ncbi:MULTISPECIES: UDP-N-acetylglucosamine 2-epimerase [Amycolatopsis]|uniref:UDP-N-acetylglucosamine 2-epimerase n=1 Tax=Amycolatopsis tucumanensis TaxID=401106 RepID=A0ABP7I770_9PSEU|nr:MULTISPECIES: UDP-N-acetylglucosamine 2-epimerase [Amycolatopsis]MCF6426199.1 UDP-N-acetylglucosamine 2-epimerase [Amycolatopsis tucumanensis]
MRRICVFTASRADYGPLLALIEELHRDQDIDLRLLVSGGHLVDGQGHTVEVIERDGFPIGGRVDMVLCGDTPTAVAKSFGVGVLGYADALDRIGPDVLVVLGDRYEALAVATVAMLQGRLVAHIAGGQITEGALDDSLRHAITKLSDLHFTATPEFRRRVVQLGEAPERVHCVGALGLDSVRTLPLMSRGELLDDLGLPDETRLIAVTYHPATADPDGSDEGLNGLLDALGEMKTHVAVFTGANVDAGGGRIARRISRFVADHADRAVLVPSLGQRRYLSLLNHADVVAGNSSSALVEAPALRTPTVNIGSRQDGRPRAPSVIDSGCGADQIAEALHRAMSEPHRELTNRSTSPFGDGHAAQRIAGILRAVPVGKPRKAFHDVQFEVRG